MKGAPYPSARRTQRKHERNKRVRAGVPSIRHDWQCHICHKWCSNYRGRNLLHLQSCELKEAERVAHEERRRARIVALPSPVRFHPYSTLNATSFSRSLAREFPIVGGDVEQQEDLDSFEPFVPDQALLRDDESLGEFNIILRKAVRIYLHNSFQMG